MFQNIACPICNIMDTNPNFSVLREKFCNKSLSLCEIFRLEEAPSCLICNINIKISYGKQFKINN